MSSGSVLFFPVPSTDGAYLIATQIKAAYRDRRIRYRFLVWHCFRGHVISLYKKANWLRNNRRVPKCHPN